MAMGVSVAEATIGVNVGVLAPPAVGVALNKAATVCAAAVLAIFSTLLEGRLHALSNKVITISRL
jgi:hypothetical protein